jgi:hypothetical protein
MGAAAVAVAVLVLAIGRRHLEGTAGPAGHSQAEGELLATADAS